MCTIRKFTPIINLCLLSHFVCPQFIVAKEGEHIILAKTEEGATPVHFAAGEIFIEASGIEVSVFLGHPFFRTSSSVDVIYGDVCMCFVCVCMCVRGCVHACVCMSTIAAVPIAL